MKYHKLIFFQLQCYSIINRELETWEGARTQCKNKGGNLASILSKHVQGLSFLYYTFSFITKESKGLNPFIICVFMLCHTNRKIYFMLPGKICSGHMKVCP